MTPTLSPLVRGLSKLMEKGDWAFWIGEDVWWSMTPSSTSFDCRVKLCRCDNETRVNLGNRWGPDEPLTSEESSHLYEVGMRVYVNPYLQREREKRDASLVVEYERMAQIRRALEEAGATP